MGIVMTTARQKVFSQLQKHRSMSAREIARALKMSAPNVRHHLSVLAADGLIDLAGTLPKGGRGRPQKVYSLSQAALGDNLSVLADALLTEAGSTVRIDALAKRVLPPAQFANMPVSKRLALLVEKLNEMHYQARWEAGAEGPRLLFGRCPYARVIARHAELCEMDAALLKNALAKPVAQIARGEAAYGYCPFVHVIG